MPVNRRQNKKNDLVLPLLQISTTASNSRIYYWLKLKGRESPSPVHAREEREGKKKRTKHETFLTSLDPAMIFGFFDVFRDGLLPNFDLIAMGASARALSLSLSPPFD